MNKIMVTIAKDVLCEKREQGYDAFLEFILDEYKEKVGKDLTSEALSQLPSDVITLWAYSIVQQEVSDGGFIQLIHNGYGPFIFDNPFAKAMRLWGLKDFSKYIYKAKKLYDEHKNALTVECGDEDFMALFEQHPQFDDLDDEFIEMEEEVTDAIAQYVEKNIGLFCMTDAISGTSGSDPSL